MNPFPRAFLPYLNSLTNCIGKFSDINKERGVWYYPNRVIDVVSVFDEQELPTGIRASVRGSNNYTVNWRLALAGDGSAIWDNSCTCPIGQNCKHAYAAALSFLVEAELAHRFPWSTPSHGNVREIVSDIRHGFPLLFNGDDPSAGDASSWRNPHVEELARQLETASQKRPTNSEIRTLCEIVKIWENKVAIVNGNELNTLGIRDPNNHPLPYYDSSIRLCASGRPNFPSPLKLWRYIAFCAARENHYKLPEFLDPLRDDEEVIKEKERMRRAAAVTYWGGKFQKEANPDTFLTLPKTTTSETGPLPEMRLQFDKPRLLWEARENENSPWTPARALPKQCLKDFAENRLFLEADTPLHALFSKITTLYQDGLINGGIHYGVEMHTLRIEDLRTQLLIEWILRSPFTQGLLVSENRRPFALPPIPLKWHAAPTKEKPENVALKLVRPDGEEVNASAFTLLDQLDEVLAIQGETIYTCPPKIEVADEIHVANPYATPPEIPAEVFSLPGASRFARRHKIEAPALRLPEVKIIPLRPVFEVYIKTSENTPSRSFAVIQLNAYADGGELPLFCLLGDSWSSNMRSRNGRENWNESWNENGLKKSAPGVQTEYDDSAVHAAERYLRQSELNWDYPSRAFLFALKKTGIEPFVEWLDGARRSGAELRLPPELASLARAPDTATLEIEFSTPPDAIGSGGSGIDWFDVQIALKPTDTDLSNEELQLLLRANGKFVNLPGKGWRRLHVAVDEGKLDSLRALGITPEDMDSAAGRHRFHTLQLADERIAGLLPEQHAERIRERAAALRAIPRPDIPPGLNATLRPYQIEGYHFLAHLAENHLGGILADDMGLGKTVQTLAWLLWLKDNKRTLESRENADDADEQGVAAASAATNRPTANAPLRALVVCPKSVVPNWLLETARFSPSLNAATLADAAHVPGGPNLTVINYAQLRGNADELAARAWDAVILDEGQNIKNPASQTARAARELNARHRLVLTGTPIENRALDLWSLFAFAMPGLLGTQGDFKRRYKDKTDPLARSRLAVRARHFMLRRAKSQVATDLPQRIEEDLLVELEGAQRKLYDAELKRARMAMLNIQTARQFDLARFNILQSLLRLRQICCHPALIGFQGNATTTDTTDAEAIGIAEDSALPAASDNTAVSVTAPIIPITPIIPIPTGPATPAVSATTELPPTPTATTTAAAAAAPPLTAAPSAPSAKLDAFLEQLELILEEGHRVLVFSQFVSMLELIAAALDHQRTPYLMLTGKTENRRELVDAFQAPDGPPVFLLSLKAAGSGLNLTAASYVFLFDPWWNPAVEAQAIDRTHRIGQTNQVIAYRLIAKNTIEEKIRQLQQKKAALARAIVQEESLATVLNLDDIRYVLE
jgi:SNF2 family DNA or RNA helicase